MTRDEVYCNLCYKYPFWYFDGDDVPPTPRNKCNCDNCFYGRDRLAVEILKLIGEKEKNYD